tara:strand:+ start:351 stop:452 length:102 start_codon:yes stop_codon:yes gene_type:complete
LIHKNINCLAEISLPIRDKDIIYIKVFSDEMRI